MSYRLKLTIVISLLIAVSFGVGGTLIISTSFQASLIQETQTALSNFETVQNTLYILNSLSSESNYKSLAKALEQMEMQRLGNWQALSLQTVDHKIFLSGNPALLAYELTFPTENQCSYMYIRDSQGYAVLLLRVIQAGDTDLQLLARFDLSSVYATRQIQQKQYFIVYAIVVILGILASAVLSYMLTKHLRRLTVTAREISAGNYSVRSKISSKDEFGQLSMDFDHMADKLQENIRHLEADMQRQENFMGAFAHELKTPMTSIIGFADLLRQGNLDDNMRMMAANYIYSESRRLERLSFQLLELILMKKDQIQFRTVSLNSYLSEIEQAMLPSLKMKNIQLVCKADNLRVSFAPDLVKSLIYNLVDNASKSITGSGVIAIHATGIDGGCQFQIADNGRGMEQSELSKITEPFYRVDKARARSQGGAGIGLALCKQIAELHSGSISFSSKLGKGTRVTVMLYDKVGESNAEV